MALPLLLPGTEFAVLTKLYFGALDRRLSNIGIDRYFSLIIYLSVTEEPPTQQDIAVKFKMDKTFVVRVVDYLADKGFVERVVNPADRRAYFIRLTALAESKVPAIKKAITEVNNLAFEGMKTEETDQFMARLEKIKNNLSGEPALDFELNYKLAN